MATVKERRAQESEREEEYFLGEIYKNTKMGADAIINLLPHVKDDTVRSLLTMQLDGYEKYAARAAKQLRERDVTPKEEGFLTRVGARFGITLQTMFDSTTSHIAELVVEGSNMGITEMTKLLNTYVPLGEAQEAVQLAREVVAFEEHNLELMKRFL